MKRESALTACARPVVSLAGRPPPVYRRLASLPGGEDSVSSPAQRRVVVDREGEAGVGGRVLVSAVDARVVGQGRQALEAGPHLLGCTLEQASAAESEERVADEGDVVGAVVVGDVTQRVAAAVNHRELRFTEVHQVTPDHCSIEGRDPGHLGWPHDAGAGSGLDLGVAAGVVRMPVGVEDVVERPARLLKLSEDRPGVWRVDAGGRAGGVVADQEAVVI